MITAWLFLSLSEHVARSICRAETDFLIWMAPWEIRNSTLCILLFKFSYNFHWHPIVISTRLYAGILSVLCYSPYPAVSSNYYLQAFMILRLLRTGSEFLWMKRTCKIFFLLKKNIKWHKNVSYLFNTTLGSHKYSYFLPFWKLFFKITFSDD